MFWQLPVFTSKHFLIRTLIHLRNTERIVLNDIDVQKIPNIHQWCFSSKIKGIVLDMLYAIHSYTKMEKHGIDFSQKLFNSETSETV